MIRHDRYYISKQQQGFIDAGIAEEGVFWLRFNGREKDCLKARNYFNENYEVFQLNMNNFGEHELFYWSNESIIGKLVYFNITIAGHDEFNQVQNVVSTALELADQIHSICPDLEVTVQYRAMFDTERVKKMAESNFEENKNKFVTNEFGTVGRIKKVRDHYGFFKKGAKTRYTRLKEIDVVHLCTGI